MDVVGWGVVMVLLGAFFLRPLVESTRPGGSIGPDQPHQGLADWLLPDFPPPPELQFRPSMFWISDYWRYLFGFSFLFFNGLFKKKQKKTRNCRPKVQHHQRQGCSQASGW